MDYHKNAPWTAISREQLARMVIDEGATLKSAACRFCVSPKTASKWVSRYRQAYFGDLLRNVAGVIQVHEAFAWVPGPQNRLPIYCLITELADGSDLASWLERNPGAWKESKARREIIKLLRTIGCLHERGAVHRDLTPEQCVRDVATVSQSRRLWPCSSPLRQARRRSRRLCAMARAARNGRRRNDDLAAS